MTIDYSRRPHDIGHAPGHLRGRGGWFAAFGLAVALLGFVSLGVLILAGWPENSAYVLGIFLGLDMIMYGASWLSFGLFLRRRLHLLS